MHGPDEAFYERRLPVLVHRIRGETSQGNAHGERMLESMSEMKQPENLRVPYAYPRHAQLVFVSDMNVLDSYLHVVDNFGHHRLDKALRLPLVRIIAL